MTLRRQRGFSLIEVLVGILILGIVITTSLAVFVERKKRLLQASEILLAYQCLANEAELQRREPYLNVQNGTFKGDVSILAPLAPYATFVLVDASQPDMKNVTLLIRWRNGQRQAKLGIVRVDTGGQGFW